ncbi:MAG: Nif3-like dinuclear metal center hexameric protein [Acidaminococcaceae bacterium]
MVTKVNDICEVMEKLAPQKLAEEWDNVGLMLGSNDWPVGKVMLALDLTEEVASQACAQKADMIITHHPFFFSPLKKLVYSEGKNALVYELIRNKIAVYSAHTNLDIAKGGVNDVLADVLGLKQTEVLKPVFCDKYYKLVVYVPLTHVDDVLSALSRAGVGRIGNYADCAYIMEGEGQFRPLPGSNPFLGKQGILEKTREKRIEILLKESELQEAIKAVLEAHPYEEPAYDILERVNVRAEFGLGRVGVLKKPLSLGEFANNVKNALAIDYVIVADAGKPVYKVAVCGGSGTDFIAEAAKAGADTFVTGDVKYHVAQEALNVGINLIDAGHQTSEMPVLTKLQKELEDWAAANNHAIKVLRAVESQVLQHL